MTKRSEFIFLASIALIHSVCSHKPFLEYLRSQANSLEKGLDSIIRSGGYISHNGGIAFSARQSSARTYKQHETWIFDTVLVNDGNAYNKATGTFTAPVGGTYGFTWATLTNPSKAAHPYLRVNGHYKGYTAFNNRHTSQKVWSSGSNTILVHLKKGDTVNIASGYLAAYAREIFSSFSGWKIY
ncbi:complement C1q-like protein 4 [Ostrea edulis]|uniref:complement C1q-like protein 4 n=1 Tax=Ostrea edulis TaxID=37623 RepID=UPI0020955A73|nr:complement C1q-like protein 4 [Ostrea edulis]XP_056010012.1 complement C1q-like protein 4 [Ostrea edulis]